MCLNVGFNENKTLTVLSSLLGGDVELIDLISVCHRCWCVGILQVLSQPETISLLRNAVALSS